MHLSRSWLEEFLDLKGIDNQKLADLFTLSGSEVKSITTTGGDFEGVVVAEIQELRPHPNADKLQLATITTGSETLEVVCGAKNIAIGQRVPYAAAGARLGDLVLEKRPIRGIVSNGMLCSARELGMGEDHSGILQLPTDTPLGIDIHAVLPKGDTIFAFEITPNRPDCLSVLGLAHEASALVQQPLKKNPYIEKLPKVPTKETVSVTIENPDHCYRYAGLLLQNVKVGTSPDWMQDRLRSADIRPINTVVDITNYVLLELGQPLHAFDIAKFGEPKVIVRQAKDKEKIQTLDGQTRELSTEMIVIASSKEPVAIAGIMGGYTTSVDETTTSVLLESANFDWVSIRKASEKLALRSEASQRFEKNIAPQLVDHAIWRAAHLLEELCGGDVVGYADEWSPSASKEKAKELLVTSTDCLRILGIQVSEATAQGILERLGCVVTSTKQIDSWSLTVTAPWWRKDIREKYCLLEEIGRILDYNTFPDTVPVGAYSVSASVGKEDRVEKAKDVLVSCGFSEAYCYTMTSLADMKACSVTPESSIPLRDPLAEFSHVRRSLLIGLTKAMRDNKSRNPRLPSLKLFEVGRIFLPEKQQDDLPLQPTMLGGIGFPLTYPEIKGIIEKVAQSLGVGRVTAIQIDAKKLPPALQTLSGLLDPAASACFLLDGKPVAVGGVFTKGAIQSSVEGVKHLGAFEIILDVFTEHFVVIPPFTPLSKFPPVYFDSAYILDQGTSAQAMIDALEKLSTETVRVSAFIFDIYQGDKLPIGKKSVAFTTTFQPYEATLSDTETTQWQNKSIEVITKQFTGELRDKKLG